MNMARSPQQVADRYSRGVSGAGTDWLQGINSTDKDPGALAAQAGPKWQQACNTPEALANFVKVAQVPKSLWQSQSAKAQSNYTGSTAKSAAKVLKQAPILLAMGAAMSQAATAAGSDPLGRVGAAMQKAKDYSSQLRAARY
jgi:hypothetical protein